MCDKNVKKWGREVEGILGERERIFKEKKKKKTYTRMWRYSKG